VENPIGAGASWDFGPGSETDPQAVTLCGARSASAAEARERKGREVGSTAAGGRASEGKTPRGPRGGRLLRFGAARRLLTLRGGFNPSKLRREAEFALQQHGRKVHGDVSPSLRGAKPWR